MVADAADHPRTVLAGLQFGFAQSPVKPFENVTLAMIVETSANVTVVAVAVVKWKSLVDFQGRGASVFSTSFSPPAGCCFLNLSRFQPQDRNRQGHRERLACRRVHVSKAFIASLNLRSTPMSFGHRTSFHLAASARTPALPIQPLHCTLAGIDHVIRSSSTPWRSTIGCLRTPLAQRLRYRSSLGQ